MDARERLRMYLEQRRELGESEFVLDSMSIDDALAAIDTLRSTSTPRSRPVRPTPTSRSTPTRPVVSPPHSDSRTATAPDPSSTETAAPRVQECVPERLPERVSAPAETVAASPDDGAPRDIRPGLVVGTANGTLFEQNPFHGVVSLDALAKVIEDCTRCPLYETAKHAVPGAGSHEAELMCVGEAPGANEDETGQPFVGQAGALLTKILAAIDLSRDQVFITNVLKHRPPGNRNPQPREVEACSPYLVRQIQMVKPKVILALGTFAAQTLLDTKTPIGKLRGEVHRYYGIPLIVTYHPAALLRNPAWKRPTWEDVKLARHVLDSAKS